MRSKRGIVCYVKCQIFDVGIGARVTNGTVKETVARRWCVSLQFVNDQVGLVAVDAFAQIALQQVVVGGVRGSATVRLLLGDERLLVERHAGVCCRRLTTQLRAERERLELWHAQQFLSIARLLGEQRFKQVVARLWSMTGLDELFKMLCARERGEEATRGAFARGEERVDVDAARAARLAVTLVCLVQRHKLAITGHDVRKESHKRLFHQCIVLTQHNKKNDNK